MNYHLERDPREEEVNDANFVGQIESDLHKNTDYYLALGVSKFATPEEIKSAYRCLCLQCHPDRLHNLPEGLEKEQKLEKYKAAKNAYDVLSVSELRLRYNTFQNI
jgi:DnaJ-class molecular chaperone